MPDPVIPSYTTVVGIDVKHFKQLLAVWLTWTKHKPSLLDHPMLIFYDTSDPRLSESDIRKYIDHPNLSVIPWDVKESNYCLDGKEKDSNLKWYSPRRYKMLAGFVHIPALHVETDYWLKLDTDTVAIGQDNWIDPQWWKGKVCPRIIAHRWSFTKPPYQMVDLDYWAYANKLLFDYSPLNLEPKPGHSRISHKRIISWCGFFQTEFTRYVAEVANSLCGQGLLPVPSQDGYMWYMAKRLDPDSVIRINAKGLGWKHRSSYKGILQAVEESLGV